MTTFLVLATNNGKHSDEKLAIATAADIVNIGATASGEQAIEGRKLENKIADVLEKHFASVSEFEHAGIAANGPAHLALSLDPHPGIHMSAVDEVMAAINESPIAKWFMLDDLNKNAELRKNIHYQIGKRIKDAQHMHRDWYARWGKIGDHTNLKMVDGHDQLAHALDSHVKRWKDMHDGDEAAYRQAVHEHASALAGA